jgi:hypothetical protein
VTLGPIYQAALAQVPESMRAEMNRRAHIQQRILLAALQAEEVCRAIDQRARDQATLALFESFDEVDRVEPVFWTGHLIVSNRNLQAAVQALDANDDMRFSWWEGKESPSKLQGFWPEGDERGDT